MRRPGQTRRSALAALGLGVLGLPFAHAAAASSRHRNKPASRRRAKAAASNFPRTNYKVEQIIAPSPMHGIQGIAFGPDGALYAGSVIGRSLYRIDVRSGAAMSVLGAPRESAGDIAFGPDGSLAWAAVSEGAIMLRTAAGIVRTVARDIPGVRGVGFAKNGALYFSRFGEEDGLYAADLGGSAPPRLVTPNVGGLGPFEIDENGMLYGAALFRRAVMKINIATGEMTKVAADFKSPSTVRLGHDGAPIVIDRGTGQIMRVNVASGDKDVIASLDPPVDSFAIGKDGVLFVTSAPFNGITAIDPTTKSMRRVTWSNLCAPGMLTAIPSENGEVLLIADAWGARRFDPSSGAVTLIGGGAGVYGATSIAVDGDAYVLCNALPAGSIQIIARDSGEVRANLTNFGAPYGVVAVADGFVVADYAVGRLTKVAHDAAHTRTTLAWGFDGPVGLADAGKGILYVSEYDSGKITRVDTATNERTALVAGLSAPEGIAFGSDGRLIVAEAGAGRILAVNLSDGSVTILADKLAIGLPGGGTGPFLPTGVTVGRNGSIYVTGDIDNVLYRLTRPEPAPAK